MAIYNKAFIVNKAIPHVTYIEIYKVLTARLVVFVREVQKFQKSFLDIAG